MIADGRLEIHEAQAGDSFGCWRRRTSSTDRGHHRRRAVGGRAAHRYHPLRIYLVHPVDGAVMDGIAAGDLCAAKPAAYGLHACALSNEGVLVALGVEPPRPAVAR